MPLEANQTKQYRIAGVGGWVGQTAAVGAIRAPVAQVAISIRHSTDLSYIIYSIHFYNCLPVWFILTLKTQPLP
jgi:hypothetical protein